MGQPEGIGRPSVMVPGAVLLGGGGHGLYRHDFGEMAASAEIQDTNKGSARYFDGRARRAEARSHYLRC